MNKYSLIYLSILVSLSSTISTSRTIIVAESGGDYNNIQSALNIAVAGDTILVREKSEAYLEKIAFPRSGNSTDGHIVLMNYPNQNPVIDGDNISFVNDSPQGLVRIIDKSYIKVIGFEIGNVVVSDNDIFPAGIWIYGSLSNVEIRNNKIHTIQQNANDAGAHGLAVYGTHQSVPISELLIDGNEIYNCKLGWSESLVLNGNVENFIVSNNVVHDNNNIAFDFIGHEGECPNPELDQARNGIVTDNIAFNIDSRGNQAYGDEASADGFYIDGGKDIVIERNTVYNCNIGIEIASEHGGKSTSGIIVRNNLVRENSVYGIAIGGYDSQRGSTSDCKIMNNTLYKNNSENLDWGVEMLVQFYCEDNIISNNIIVSKSNTPMLDHTSNTGNNNVFTNNLYFTEGNAKWNYGSTSYSNFGNYKIGSGQEMNSLYGNPMLINPENDNPNIQKNSPAIDHGENFESSITSNFDYFGNRRVVNEIIDIGAVESNDVTDIKSLDQIIRSSFELLPAYPNPFNPTTTISFDISSRNNSNKLTLKIFDSLGRIFLDKTIFLNGNLHHNYKWNAENNKSGIYYVAINSRSERKVRKLVLMK
jgi:Secretion system C-terminal sorting domain